MKTRMEKWKLLRTILEQEKELVEYSLGIHNEKHSLDELFDYPMEQLEKIIDDLKRGNKNESIYSSNR